MHNQHWIKSRVMINKYIIYIITLVGIFIFSCNSSSSRQLPIIGKKVISGGDTIYHTVPTFQFIDQDSNIITHQTFEGKAYVVDFFFTSCPTICPKVKKEMLRIYDHFEQEDKLKFLSHSIDTRRDSVPHLKQYAENLGIETDRWHLVTGKKSDIYDIADDYFSVAKEDPLAPGGYDHSGRLILIDPQKHVRSFCDGTNPKEVDRFIQDIEKLLVELHEE